MSASVREAAVLLLLAAPWLAMPVAAVLAARGRLALAVLVSVTLTFGAWAGFFALEHRATGGNMIGGSSGAVGAALRGAVMAFVMALIGAALGAFWRRRRAVA